MQALVTRLYAAPVVLLALTTLFWAGNAVAGQLAVEEVRPLLLVFLRWAMVSAALWPMFGRELMAHWPTLRPRLRELVILAALGFTGFNALFYAAAYLTPAVNIGILQGSIPVFVLIFARVALGTRISLVQGIGVALTILGVVLVATRGAPQTILEIGLNGGDVLMVAACALYAFYTLGISRRPDVPGRALFLFFALVATAAALPLAIGEAILLGPTLPTAQGWLVTLYVAVFPSCLAQLFFLRGVDLIGPGRAGIFVNLVPVFAALLAVVLLGEAFAWFHGAALALVLGGIWLAQRPTARISRPGRSD